MVVIAVYACYGFVGFSLGYLAHYVFLWWRERRTKTQITSPNHGLVNGQVVVISGARNRNSNGVFSIVKRTDDTCFVRVSILRTLLRKLRIALY